MKHVIWNEQSDEKTLGPGLAQGIGQARAALLSTGPVSDANRFSSLKGDQPALTAAGGFDADLKRWVKNFQLNCAPVVASSSGRVSPTWYASMQSKIFGAASITRNV